MLVLLAACAFVANSCQQSQVRLDKEQAIAKARPEAGFDPGAHAGPARAPGPDRAPVLGGLVLGPAPARDVYTKLTTVRIDANTGSIEAVNRER